MKLGVAGVFVLLVGCSLPNLGAVQQIKAGACIDACKVTLDACFDVVDKRVTLCQSIENGDQTATSRQDCIYATGQYEGQKSVLKMTKECIGADQTCIAKCIKDVEDTLKEIK